MRVIEYENYKERTQKWIISIIASMDERLNMESRVDLLEACGRACARGNIAQIAEQFAGNLEKFVTMMRMHGGDDTITIDGDTITIFCRECLCPLMGDAHNDLSSSFCYCSLGFMKETFRTIIGKPMEVELIESIKQGAKRCHFIVRPIITA